MRFVLLAASLGLASARFDLRNSGYEQIQLSDYLPISSDGGNQQDYNKELGTQAVPKASSSVSINSWFSNQRSVNGKNGNVQSYSGRTKNGNVQPNAPVIRVIPGGLIASEPIFKTIPGIRISRPSGLTGNMPSPCQMAPRTTTQRPRSSPCGIRTTKPAAKPTPRTTRSTTPKTTRTTRPPTTRTTYRPTQSTTTTTERPPTTTTRRTTTTTRAARPTTATGTTITTTRSVPAPRPGETPFIGRPGEMVIPPPPGGVIQGAGSGISSPALRPPTGDPQANPGVAPSGYESVKFVADSDAEFSSRGWRQTSANYDGTTASQLNVGAHRIFTGKI